MKRELFGAFERLSSVLHKHYEDVLVKKTMLSDRECVYYLNILQVYYLNQYLSVLGLCENVYQH